MAPDTHGQPCITRWWHGFAHLTTGWFHKQWKKDRFSLGNSYALTTLLNKCYDYFGTMSMVVSGGLNAKHRTSFLCVLKFGVYVHYRSSRTLENSSDPVTIQGMPSSEANKFGGIRGKVTKWVSTFICANVLLVTIGAPQCLGIQLHRFQLLMLPINVHEEWKYRTNNHWIG